MQILVTGAEGRLGSALVELLTARGHTVSGYDVETLDVTDGDTVRRTVSEHAPEMVIHCAALTNVDYCAQHPDEALAVNGYGTQAIAQACQAHGAALLYVSTNEVFDGKADRPYQEYDRPNPPNPYGYSKWIGEQAARDLCPRHMIVRSSWLFARGGANFAQSILRLARDGKPLRVVTNEVSTPTYNDDLAAAIAQLVEAGRYGIYHLVNEGQASRYEFARRVLDLAGYGDVAIQPIALAEYRRASRPPEYAALRNVAAAHLGIRLRPWQDALAAFVQAEHLQRE